MGGEARGDIDDLDFEARRGFGLGHVGDEVRVRRPGRSFVGGVGRGGEVGDFAGLRADEEDIPELVAVLIAHVGDPLAVGRPGGRGLALIADGELGGPASGGGDSPEVVASADVGDEGDLGAVGRPDAAADLAGAVERRDGELLEALDGGGLELGGVGDSLRNGKRLRCGMGAHADDDSKCEARKHEGSVAKLDGVVDLKVAGARLCGVSFVSRLPCCA